MKDIIDSKSINIDIPLIIGSNDPMINFKLFNFINDNYDMDSFKIVKNKYINLSYSFGIEDKEIINLLTNGKIYINNIYIRNRMEVKSLDRIQQFKEYVLHETYDLHKYLVDNNLNKVNKKKTIFINLYCDYLISE